MNKDNLNDCPDFLQDFLFYMETIKGRSPRTVDGYYIDLRSFIRFLMIDNGLVSDDIDYKEIKIHDASFDLIKNATRTDAMRFLSEFQRNHDNEAKARSRKVSAIRSFYKYLTIRTKQLQENPVADLEYPKLRKSLPKYLTMSQASALLRE